MRATAEERFWSKVERAGPADCWLWTGVKNNLGYGYFRVSNSLPMKSVHRLSWGWANGPIPKGMAVLHTCDVRNCVNPAHLWLGTQLENIADRDAKGRNRGLTDLLEINRNGGWMVKRQWLTWGEVDAIRAAAAQGASRRALAEQYGTSYDAISNIVNGKTYRHAVA